ncbi:hypothetical protein [Streptomyces wuyuanensis]|uniref:hypothetical protein n=1 Tax=Streptomyces wuyuanensis TaxID=1196353 RepID=UPI0034188856
MHVNSELLTTAASAIGAVALVFIGAWENGRRTRKTETRKDAAADRAALEAQANELVAAILALRIAGNVHDHAWGGWGARGRVALRALLQGGATYALSGRGGAPALLAAYGEVGRIIGRWDQESATSAAELAAPLSRLGSAVAPLLRREEPGLAEAADAVFSAAVEHYGDNERMAAALAAFHAALRPALAPPAPARRWWHLRRRRNA